LPAAIDRQVAKLAVAAGDALAAQLHPGLPVAVQGGVQAELTQARCLECQALAIEAEGALRRLQAAGQVQSPGGPSLQPGPQLTEAIEGDAQLALQALIQLATAVDTVVAQPHVQRA